MMLSSTFTRALSRAAVVPVLAGGVFLGASSASAHVTITPSTTAAGGSSVLTFSVGHGCEGSPTRRIAIQMPEDVISVTPTRNPLWKVKKVKKVMEKLDEPITDAHGNEISERVSQVVYTARTPLPDGERDAFELSLSLPDAEGETFAFPTIQSCVKGQTAWTEVAADGQDGEDLESPAPLVTITDAEDDGHGHGASSASDDDSASGSESESGSGDKGGEESADEDGDGNGLAIAGLVAGILGLLAGGAALASSRRKS